MARCRELFVRFILPSPLQRYLTLRNIGPIDGAPGNRVARTFVCMPSLLLTISVIRDAEDSGFCRFNHVRATNRDKEDTRFLTALFLTFRSSYKIDKGVSASKIYKFIDCVGLLHVLPKTRFKRFHELP